MNSTIVYSIILLVILLVIYVFSEDQIEAFIYCRDNKKNNRNIAEGFFSYHKRMFTKHVHRPIKLKARKHYKNLRTKYNHFKRNVF